MVKGGASLPCADCARRYSVQYSPDGSLNAGKFRARFKSDWIQLRPQIGRLVWQYECAFPGMILLGVLEMFCIGIVQAFCTAGAGSVLFECLVRQWLADLGSWSLGLKVI
jgi:hypothetical protein